ncbi:MAG: thioredoxin [Planctomycetes bacterium]|nr:thioredoxin [Planctomycetota bacterium]
MSTIQHVTAEDFVAEVVDSAVPVLVDFYADWCGPCRMLGPVLERLAGEYRGRVKIVKVDVDAEPALASHFRVQSIPMLLAYQDGRPVDRLVGIGSPGQLRQLLNSLTGATVRMG